MWRRTETSEWGDDFVPDPPLSADDAELGGWLKEQLLQLLDAEDDPWAVNLVQGAAGRLNRVRAPEPPLSPVLLWVATVGAFTGPGRYVYLSRGLLHRAWWEEAVAFVTAHEMAHHDLGHTRCLDRLGWARRLPGALGALAFLAAIRSERRWGAEIRSWLWQRGRGYAALTERRQVLEARLRTHGSAPIPPVPADSGKGKRLRPVPSS